MVLGNDFPSTLQVCRDFSIVFCKKTQQNKVWFRSLKIPIAQEDVFTPGIVTNSAKDPNTQAYWSRMGQVETPSMFLPSVFKIQFFSIEAAKTFEFVEFWEFLFQHLMNKARSA